MTIKKALDQIKNKQISATELVQNSLAQIKKHDSKINAFITVCEKQALEKAKQLDNSDADLPLKGIPIALKDLFVTKNIKTTAGSNVLKDYIPPYTATSIKRLEEAGAIIIGKLNEDAWGHGASGENTDFIPTKNPWDLTTVPGGSSSGSAAAVAASMCLASAGTDTGGSIRQPASFCNLVGLKPTYGRVSRYGVSAMASSLDTIGHFTHTVWDNAKYLEITAGHDPFDATTPDIKVPSYTNFIEQNTNIKNLKIGIPKQYFIDGLDKQVESTIKTAISQLEKLGAKIEEISLPHTEYGVAVYYIIMSSETSSNLGRYDGIRYGNDRSYFGDEAKRRIMLGTYTLSAGYYDAYYKKAMKVRTLIAQDFENAFTKVDAIISPVSPTPAFKFGAKQDPLQMYLADVFTIPSSLAGIPGLSVPCGFTDTNLPIGMQILTPQFKEELLYQIANVYEQSTDWHKKEPSL